MKIYKTKPKGTDEYTTTHYGIPQGKDKEGHPIPWKRKRLKIGDKYDIVTDEPGQEICMTAKFIGWKKSAIVLNDGTIRPENISYLALFEAVGYIEIDTAYNFKHNQSRGGERMILTVQTDGSCMPNPGDMGIGVVIYKENGMIEEAISQFIGHGTNNIAEYTAFIRGLEEVKKIKRPGDQVKIFVDSLLVLKQIRGEWKVKKQELKPLCERGKELIEEIEDIEIIWMSREGNGKADRLAREAIELKRITRREEKKR